jgi:hypothetical protein
MMIPMTYFTTEISRQRTRISQRRMGAMEAAPPEFAQYNIRNGA